MSQIKRHLDGLADPGSAAAHQLLQSTESALALEAISSYLQGVKPQLGAVALNLANLAIEGLCLTPSLKAAPLVFSLEGLEENPQAVVDEGVKAIQQQIEAAWGEVDGCLAKVMSSQVGKMAAFKGRAEKLRASVDELHAQLAALPHTAVAQRQFLEPSLALFRLSRSDKGFTPSAGDVNSTLDTLLKSHGDAFQRVVTEKVKWLAANQRELIANVDVFKSLTFNPSDLLIMNGQAGEATPQGTAPYYSEELPGGYCLQMHLPTGPVEGLAAVDAIKSVHFDVAKCAEPADAKDFNALSAAEAKQLLAKVYNTMTGLGSWYHSIYQDLWCNDEYGGLLCDAVIRGLREGAGAREFKTYAITILYLMHKATVGVDTYVFETLEAEVAYLRASFYHLSQQG